MSVGLQVWSQTASVNSTVDTNINWAEGMAPSQVNDSARALMASMSKWRDDNNGTLVTSGTTTAFTATSSQVSTGLVAGYTVTIQFSATADTSATLNVDAQGAKPLQIVAGTNLQGGEFTAGDICRFTYSSTGTGQWIANSAPGYIQNSNQIAASKVTYAKIQNETASTLLGNPTGGSAAPSEITLGTNLTFAGSVLNAGTTTPNIQVFTSGSSATYTTPTNAQSALPQYIRIQMIGGGGGGAAVTTNQGSAGNNSSFASWTAVAGSGGATQSNGGAGGSGGTNSTGTLITRVPGGAGCPGVNNGTGAAPGGNGGSGFFGGAGGGGNSGGTGTGGTAGANSGAGGGGGSNSGNSGGGGGSGEYVEFIITSPAASYTYTVGTGGGGGAAGGAAGGAGAAGYIAVIAYWQ